MTPRTLASLARVAAVVIFVTVPPFLVAAFALELRRDLGLSDALIGAFMTVYFLVVAVLSPWAGGKVDTLGHRVGMRIAIGGVGAALLLAALVPGGAAFLMGALIVAAAVHAFSHPSINKSLVESVPPERMGIAFGIKQAAVPAASFVAATSFALVGDRVGWRPVFAVIGLLALPLLVWWSAMAAGPAPANPRQAPSTTPTGATPAAVRRDLALLAIAFAVSIGAIHAVAVFAIPASEAIGVDPRRAAWSLSIASAAAAGMRLLLGAFVDRLPDPNPDLLLRIAAGAVFVGALSIGMLTVAGPTWLVSLLLGLGIAAGWSWTGIFVLAVVRRYDGRVGHASGSVQTGLFVGSALSPLVFGAIMQSRSPAAAWAWSSALLALGACLLYLRAHAASVEEFLSPDTQS